LPSLQQYSDPREATYEEPITGDMEMETLTQMRCVACRSDEPIVTDAEIAEFHPQVSDWDIVEVDGIKRLRRVFSFNDFAQALEFTNKVGELAEEEGHHPALMTEWGRTTVTWWTHKIRGLHRNDFVMAAKTDVLHQP
jgi:4a-hydroxytetrahydrobiopterin dehydratase